MPNIVDVSIGSGQVRFLREIDAVQESTDPMARATEQSAACGVGSAHFHVVFRITIDLEEGGVLIRNTFHWGGVVLNKDDTSQYQEVEAKAARQIAPTLRALADRIDKSVSEFDHRRDSGAKPLTNRSCCQD